MLGEKACPRPTRTTTKEWPFPKSPKMEGQHGGGAPQRDFGSGRVPPLKKKKNWKSSGKFFKGEGGITKKGHPAPEFYFGGRCAGGGGGGPSSFFEEFSPKSNG